jgi:hypothetical protein
MVYVDGRCNPPCPANSRCKAGFNNPAPFLGYVLLVVERYSPVGTIDLQTPSRVGDLQGSLLAARTLLIALWGLIGLCGPSVLSGPVLVLGSRRLLVLLVRHVMADDAAADRASDAVVNHMARHAAGQRPLQTASGFGRNRREQGRDRNGERCAGGDGGLHGVTARCVQNCTLMRISGRFRTRAASLAGRRQVGSAMRLHPVSGAKPVRNP